MNATFARSFSIRRSFRRAIAATIDAKDGYTHRHSERVAALSGRIAAELGMTQEEQQTAQLAALVHDLGKIAVPDFDAPAPGHGAAITTPASEPRTA